MPRYLIVAVILALGCSQARIRESNSQWAQGVVVPMHMCAQNRSTQHSNDAEGQRAYCGLEELLGSHIPKCVCRDEGRTPEERAAAQRYLQEAQQARQLLKGG